MPKDTQKYLQTITKFLWCKKRFLALSKSFSNKKAKTRNLKRILEMNFGKSNKVLSIYCVEVSQFSSEIQNLISYQKARVNDISYYIIIFIY